MSVYWQNNFTCLYIHTISSWHRYTVNWRHTILHRKNMRFFISRLLGVLQYFLLFFFNCVLARKLYSDNINEGKFLKNILYMASKIIIVVYLWFPISHEYYFLDYNDHLVHDGVQIWNELEDNKIISLNPNTRISRGGLRRPCDLTEPTDFEQFTECCSQWLLVTRHAVLWPSGDPYNSNVYTVRNFILNNKWDK